MRRLVAALTVLVLVGACARHDGAAVRPSGASPGPRLVSVEDLGGRVDLLTVDSPALGRKASVWVVRPRGWRPGSTGWPALYLLHGCCESRADSWLAEGGAERLTGDLDAVVIVPEGGPMGWYSDWLRGPAWETFHMTEVRGVVERRYGVGDRRAVAGLSMGGLGALAYAARHPGVFQAAASFSGVLDTSYDRPGLEELMRSFGVDPADLWGTPPAGTWREHNPVDLAARLKGVRLFVSCGDGEPGPLDGAGAALDRGERAILVRNRRFVAAARAAGVPVTTDFYGPGTHTWPYWERELDRALPTLAGSWRPGPSANPMPTA
ncbi:alpha/beta hydrolase family protein [Microbispora corallina]|uniref:Esterase family protein n=1 Tax=Microbispora corallina TaxID=83302 RepID=A0ABQ4G3R9_9ACTN|nr:alpha/beta hydrolase family protein [Microbispora corallina]GIH41643.1 hypothetical protein Mco01_46430 [Microbispora corallina]